MQLTEVLKAIRLDGNMVGEYVKCRCPFHSGSTGKTLWINCETGLWACWSSRCEHHSAKPLAQLIQLRGFDWKSALSMELACELKKPEPQAQEVYGRLREPHLVLWEVDWELAEEVIRRVDASGHGVTYAEHPLSSWLSVPAQPGMVEHDHWFPLSWMLRTRGVSPASLTRMGVGYSAQHQAFSFPLRQAGGSLVGWGKRSPYFPGYYVSGSYLRPDEPGYVPIHVPKGEVLWGWAEQRDRIMSGEPVYVVEGYIDQLKLLDAGKVAVALLGKSVTATHLSLLEKLPGPVVLWPDNDVDGLHAARKSTAAMLHLPQLRVVSDFQGRKDAGDMPRLTAQKAARSAIPGAEFLSQWTNLLQDAQMGRNP